MVIATRARFRAAALALVGFGLLWLSLANAVSLVLGRVAPALAIKFGLPSADAKAALALSIATAQPAPHADQLAHATRLAQAALRRSPINVTASVTLATIASLRHRDAVAGRLFAYSEQLSRRSSLAELWLIQNRVTRGDVAGALTHYDRAMRVTPSLRPTLLPILIQAASDPAIARALAAVMAHRPNWWSDALAPLIFQSPAPAITLPIVLRQLRLQADNDAERPLLAAAMTRLADAGAFNEAYALYLRSGGTRITGPEQVRGADFADDGGLPPFDWALHNENGKTAAIQPRQDGAGKALFLYVDADHQGELARQLLLLGPGRYRLLTRSGNVIGDELQRPRVNVACADHGSALAGLQLPASDAGGASAERDFTIAAGCQAQWLSLISEHGSDAADADVPRIDRVSVRRLE